MSRGDAPVKIASAANQAVGEMWRELLANNGIRATLRPTGPVAYLTFTNPHDLLVHPADAAAARDLLAAFDEDEADRRDGGADADGGDEYWLEGAEGGRKP